MASVTFLLGLLVGIIATSMKEPKFLEEIESQNNGNCNLQSTDGAKKLIQQHLISNIRNFYKFLDDLKPYIIFVIGFSAIAIIAYYLIQLFNGQAITDNESGILLAAILYFSITVGVLLISLYAFIFSQIIRKYY